MASEGMDKEVQCRCSPPALASPFTRTTPVHGVALNNPSNPRTPRTPAEDQSGVFSIKGCKVFLRNIERLNMSTSLVP